MIIGVGIDIVEVERISKSIKKFENRFLNKIFTESEIEYCNSKKNKFLHYAGRFAAKEAIVKSLSSCCKDGFNWLDMEIQNVANGEPTIKLFGKFYEFMGNDKKIQISISHADKYATAVAILSKDC